MVKSGLWVVAALLTASHAWQPAPQPIGWSDVESSYEHVRDYTSLYEKEERAISNGERQTIRLWFRKPLDIRLDWLNEKGKVDQTAVYRQGLNNGRLLAHRSGVLGALAGTLTLDPHDGLALADSRHSIMEVGLGGVIAHVAEDVRLGRASRLLAGEESLDGRAAYRFQLDAVSTASVMGIEGARKAAVWIDRELNLPVKVEIHGAGGTLLERHRFKGLRINVGLSDTTFTLQV